MYKRASFFVTNVMLTLYEKNDILNLRSMNNCSMNESSVKEQISNLNSNFMCTKIEEARIYGKQRGTKGTETE